MRATDGSLSFLDTEHIIAATGYRSDVHRLSFLDSELRSKLRLVGGAPWVGADFQSNVGGVYFAGPAVASSFGPVMRFVHGAGYAARTIARNFG